MKTSLSMDASDQKKTRMKLKKFLIRRPTYQAVRDKGYIKGGAQPRCRAAEPSLVLHSGFQVQPVLLLMFPDQVFGSSLSSLCQRENTSVPSFVKVCIDHVENTGMTLPSQQTRVEHAAFLQQASDFEITSTTSL